MLGIFQLLLKIRKNYVKYVAICVEAICLIPLTYICILIFAFTYKPMHIVEKDGIKCVAYVRAFLRVYVDYYEYRNPLITGDEVLFTDYFGKGGFDPFVDGYEYDSMIVTLQNIYWNQYLREKTVYSLFMNNIQERLVIFAS